MTTNSRRQLTLFLDEAEADLIEAIREKYNPQQSALIKSHVTLCREDELFDLDKVSDNLNRHQQSAITIQFGKPIRFDNGKGVLLPAIGKNDEFHKLRKAALDGLEMGCRLHEPHITLMHPRNSTCTDAVFKEIEQIELPTRFRFRTVSLIEQVNWSKWKVLKTHELLDNEPQTNI